MPIRITMKIVSIFKDVVFLGLSGETARESSFGGKRVVSVGGSVIMGDVSGKIDSR